MSGPFTNTIQQLVEQINWLQTDEKITWDNIRFDFVSKVTDSQGKYPVTFSPAFPHELVGISGKVGFDGGVRNWEFGIFDTSRTGFTAQFGLASSVGGFVAASLVGFYYVAWGR